MVMYDACALARWGIIRLIALGRYSGLILGLVCCMREREEWPLGERGADGSDNFNMSTRLSRK